MRYKRISIGLIFIFFLGIAIAKIFHRPYATKIHTELKINPAIFEPYI